MRYRRTRASGGCYFFTLVTEHRQAILTLPNNIERLREGFRRERQRHPFQIDAMVVLPDHLHCLMTLPEGDSDYSGRLARVKRYFSIGCTGVYIAVSTSREAKRERPVWQRRFWEHLIRDEDDWRCHMDYIHYNPMKHGYSASPWDWPFSSLRKAAERGWYEPGWGTSVPAEVRELIVRE